MEVIYNGNPHSFEEVGLSPDNRAFCYGDGLFETLIVRRGSCPLLSYHFKRLARGAKILQMKLAFSEKELEEFIWTLALKFPEGPLLRMRLQVWRKSGGLYIPQQQNTDFLLSASTFKKPAWEKMKVSFAKKVQLQFSAFSSLKTMNALPYVLAGIELKERQLDDIILTDINGNVAECSSSNLFWLKDGTWNTPDLNTGCIAGVMRAYLLENMRLKKIPVKEVSLPKEELVQAQSLVACNATGLYNILQLENNFFEYRDGRNRLAELIQLPVL